MGVNFFKLIKMNKIISILFTSFLLVSPALYGQNTSHIRMNQLGFLPFATKHAIIVESQTSSFIIKNSASAIVFKADLQATGVWAESGEQAKLANFTAVTSPGTYSLELSDGTVSHNFTINNGVYSNVSKAIIKAFYYNRASTELLEEHAGIYNRPAGQMDTAVVIHPSAAGPVRQAGQTIRASKGWYDAGDYNKYIVNSGITVGTLLHSYENMSQYWDTVTWNIPESHNSVPDILNEVKWNLDWMLCMQDPDDGGVYNKTTEASFSAMVMPHKVTATRYVVSKGTAAALNFAAVMAAAYRVYKPYYTNFADSCLQAAQYAWQWAEANPQKPFYNPAASQGYPAISTGGYGDNNFTDEKLWAASELLISTNDSASYAPHVKINNSYPIPSWNSVSMLSLHTLYNNRKAIAAYIDTTLIKNRIESIARSMQVQAEANAYKVPVNNFTWGSNGVVANQIICLLLGFEITSDANLLTTALAAFDYILGRNATEYSFITGYGHKASKNVHHRPSEADGIAGSIPGFIAGGPNGGNKSDCSGSYSTYAAKAYKDQTCSYTTNEVAINWQSPMSVAAHGVIYAYNTWLRNLPEKFAYVSTPHISLTRTQTQTSFSVFANHSYSVSSPNSWIDFPNATFEESSMIECNITELNNGDSIRNGKIYILIDDAIVDSISISQRGKLTSFRIEAEDFISMQGVQTEPTNDVGGGLNVGWIDNNDSMNYLLDITKSGSYTINYRYASLLANSEFYILHEDSVYSLALTEPTGNWQTWKTYTDTAYFYEGEYEIILYSLIGGFNLNYIDFTFISSDNIAPIHTPSAMPPTEEENEPDTRIATATDYSKIWISNPVKNHTIHIGGLPKMGSNFYELYTTNGTKIQEGIITDNTIFITHNIHGMILCRLVSPNKVYAQAIYVQ